MSEELMHAMRDLIDEYLERAPVEGPQLLWWLDTDPTAAALRADPRWEEWWAMVERPE